MHSTSNTPKRVSSSNRVSLQMVENALGQPQGLDPESMQQLELPSGLGINCTEVRFLSTIIEGMSAALRSHPVQPWLVVYPNGGDIYDIIEKKWIPATDSEAKGDGWANSVKDVVKSATQEGWGPWGGVIMGGCCRTGPKEIEALTRAV